MVFLSKLSEYLIQSKQTATGTALSEAESSRIEWMVSEMKKGDPESLPSKYWEELNKMNIAQLKQNGFENFKRTIALNYFTWTRVIPWDSQTTFLFHELSWGQFFRCVGRSLVSKRQDYYSPVNFLKSTFYNLVSHMIWEYLITKIGSEKFLSLREPMCGNPALIFPRKDMNVTQDLGNSLIEFHSYQEAFTKNPKATVLELGAGYGRNAYVTLKLQPQCKYIIADIPPALWISERYMKEVFPEKKIFTARSFQNFSEIAEEFAAADIVFLLSSQVALLPNQSLDFVLNISSLHEMRKNQVDYYFSHFSRLLRKQGFFYFKQWKVARVLFENETLRQEDYPIPQGWKKIFSRTAKVQTQFFEELYFKESD